MRLFRTSKLSGGATLVALLISAAPAVGVAQNPAPAPAKPPMHTEAMKDMKGMPGMSGMMAGPHHVLAMAYRDNLATFARALQGQVAQSKLVNLELAGPAVAEMRRSFDQIQQHHAAQSTMMVEHMTPAMTEMKQHMDTHLSELGGHLTALEAEVGGSVPDPAKVNTHTAAILKECSSMTAMPMKPSKPKPGN